jgi:hypothetical protein
MDRIRTREARGADVGVKVGVRVEVSVGGEVGTCVGVSINVDAGGRAVGVARTEVWQASRKTTEIRNSGSFDRIRVSYPNIMGMAR